MPWFFGESRHLSECLRIRIIQHNHTRIGAGSGCPGLRSPALPETHSAPYHHFRNLMARRENRLSAHLNESRIFARNNLCVLIKILEYHFVDFCKIYDERYAETYGMFRLERIQRLGERFAICGDYLQGIARIRCTNPDCGQDYFRPFSCKGFYLCPSCSRKRTLLFAEHLTEEVLLDLPHRQFVFTVPKALRPFFRHDRRLFADISRLIYDLIGGFYNEAAGRSLLSGMIIAHQTFGDTQGRTAGAAEERSRQCSGGILTSMQSFWRMDSTAKGRSSTSCLPAWIQWQKYSDVGLSNCWSSESF
jgi:hypothetical protein